MPTTSDQPNNAKKKNERTEEEKHHLLMPLFVAVASTIIHNIKLENVQRQHN